MKSVLQLRRNKVDNFTSREDAIEALNGKKSDCVDGELMAVRYFIDEYKTELRTILAICNVIDDETKTLSIFEDTQSLEERIKNLENTFVSFKQI